MPIMNGGGFGQAGQREGSRRDIDTDYKLVRKQSDHSVLLWTGIFLALFAVVLIIGPLVGYVAGILALGYVALLIISFTHREQNPLPAIGVLSGMAMVIVWLFFGYGIIDRFWWVELRCDWEARWKLVLVLFLLGLAVIWFFNLYRFAYEVVDPNSQPTVSPRPPGWGIMWPFKQPPPEGEVRVKEVVRDVVRDVPRPYAMGTVNTPTDNLDAARVDEGKTVMAPSGREVAVKDLIDFVKFAPNTGATFRPWKDRGWKHNQWKDVVRVWQIYGVVSANGERTTTEIVVTDLREALTRLSSAFVDDPPTPA